MDNYTPSPFMTQLIYDPTHPFATLNSELVKLFIALGCFVCLLLL